MSFRRQIGSEISQITEHLYLTGIVGVKNVNELQNKQITHVLNVARELISETYPDHIIVKYVNLRDSEEEDLQKENCLEELADYVHQVTSNGGYIVVHCVAGMSRSASVCIAYLIKHQLMTLKEAFDKVKTARDLVHPNHGFWKCLMEFELGIKGENSVQMLPSLAGSIPDINSYRKEMDIRIKLGWMDHLFFNVFIMMCLFFVQMMSIFVFR